MPMTDPLGDMLTRIRNGQQARKDSILTPASKLRTRVLDVLQREGYIRGYSEEELAGQKGLRIELKYFEGQPAIQHLARVSKPGRRVYSAARLGVRQHAARGRHNDGAETVADARKLARDQNVGGEVLAEVF
jgi:small subunit ribosomal protein S8